MLLSRKLPIAAIVITLASILSASVAGIVVGTTSLQKAEFKALGAISDGRRNQIQTYLEKIKSDLVITSKRPDIVEAFTSFEDAWNYIEGDPMKSLQDRYIHNNPHPVGKKQLLEDAEKDSYDMAHRSFHAALREVQERNGYYDVFLINMKGDVIYTVFKELDYATNLNTGQWSKTDLANVFRDVVNGKDPTKVYFRDFRGYGPSNNAPASFIAKAIQSEGDTLGVLVYQMPLDNIKAILHNRTGLGETGETLLVNRTGLLLVDSQMTEADDALKVRLDSPLLEQVDGKDVVSGELADYRNMTSVAAMAGINFEGVNWVITALIDEDEAMAGVTSMQVWVACIGLLLIAIALVASIWFARTITNPIDQIVGRMNQLASGDTSFDCSDISSSGEIGQLATSLVVFRDAAIEKAEIEVVAEQERKQREAEKAAEAQRAEQAMAALGEGLGRLAKGDMTCSIDKSFAGDFDQLRRDFNEAVAKLQTAVHSVHSSSFALNSGTKEISSASQDLTTQTEQNAASLERTSAALVEIMTTVDKTTDGAQKGQAAVSAAKSDAEQAGEVALRAVEAMGQIKNSSSEIGQIIDVIDEIAFQTNLLALNAGVEAARAGEAGRGFAVVASEVRALAQRSADAAKTINDLISNSSREVNDGVKLVEQTGEALERIVEKVSEVNGVVVQIAADAQEQAQGLRGIQDAVSQMDQTTQNNAAMAEQTTAACHSLLDESNRLQGLVSQFQLDTALGGDPLRSELQKVAPHVFEAPAPATKPQVFKSRQPVLAVASGGGADDDWEEF